MDLEFWRRRVSRLAAAERSFKELHPDFEPYFHALFSSALNQPAPRGRGARLARLVPPWLPWLGPRVWASVDMSYRRDLAPYFITAWEQADRRAGGPPPGPDLSERDA
jgi:hypothetical protein